MIASVKYSRSWFNASGGKDGGGDSCDDGRGWQKRGCMCYWIDNGRALVHCWRVMKVITEKESLVSIRNMDKLLF